ncbi:MAG: sulfatase-like hydrolase/transferase [Clostridia bacterium]|nr:sulfatase-like hydrolase/transferase [Clostridia bacterium]
MKASSNKAGRRGIVGKIALYVILFLMLLLTFSYHWTTREFGAITFAEIIFTLNMPLQGTSSTFVQSYLLRALLPAVGVTAGIIVLIALFHRWLRNRAELWEKWGKMRALRGVAWALVFVIWLGALSYSAEGRFGFISYFKSLTQQSNFIAEEYVSPAKVKLTFPEQKRNLIYIYLESAETSTQDPANGGLMAENYIPELTQLAKDNVSFSQSDLIEGASVAPLCGWTMAGIVAETAGLPLKLFKTGDGNIGASSGLYSGPVPSNAADMAALLQNQLDKGDDNVMEQYSNFLPGAVTLGDILKANGYHNVFMAGSDFVFGGRKNYCLQHGEYEILDYYVARRRRVIRPGYKVWWGFEDEVLYKWAKEELTQLYEAGEPFNFSMITADTHHQDGYVCRLCRDEYDDQYANVWRCASEQLADFVDWCRQQPFFENTTIVVAGDHCSMDTDFYKEYTYDKHDGETVRKTYNVFINPAVRPVREKNRLFTTLDLFPTTLAAMGVEIEGDRLGLGTNLFSGEETLSEKYGYEKMFDELKKKSLFYDNEILYP